MSTSVQSAVDHADVQRRTLWVLWISMVAGRGAVSAAFPVSVSAIKDMLGSDTWAGLSSGASTVGSAASAALLAAYMQRRGRRPGLVNGYVIATVGGVLAIVAIQTSQLLLFLAAMALVGVAGGTSNLGRYAAADLSAPDRRSRDISTVLFAATFGAVLFPLFIGVAGDWAESVGFDENAGGFAILILLLAFAAIFVGIFLRPDPLVVAGGLNSQSEVTNDALSFRQAVAIAWENPLTRLAFITLVLSQAVMVMVMAMTPLHMEAHGHGKGAVGAVISAHTAGMYAFSPIAGWLSDRFGRIPIIAAGGVTFVLATAMTALATEAPRLLMFPGLYLLGLAWSFGIVAGSALLTESARENDRVAVQGAADTAMNLASGLGALASGVVVSMAGFHILSLIGMAAAGGILINAYYEHRAVRPAT